jgi:hypothetical protein
MNRLRIAMLALAFAGCDKVEEVTKKAAGDGGSKKEDLHVTPAATFEAFKLALKEARFDTLYSHMASPFRKSNDADADGLLKGLTGDESSRKNAEARLRSLGIDPEAFRKLDSKQAALRLFEAHVRAHPERYDPDPREVKAISSDGQKASVRFLRGDSGREGELKFAKEDGIWKVAE